MQQRLSTLLILSLVMTFCFAAIMPDRLTSFGVIAYTTVTNSGASVIGGDIGLYPGTSVTGFPPGVQSAGGVMEVTTPKAQLAQGDVTTVYGQIANTACTETLTPAELAGRTFAPGVYCSSAPVTLNGKMYLDTQNKTGPVWIFQFAETLTTAASSEVIFIGTPAPCNVFWNIGTSVTLGSTSIFMGIINAYTSISLGTGVAITGKCMAQTGAVTLLGNTLTNCVEQAPGISQCYGINSTHPTVCTNGNGTCVNTNACVCKSGYAGTQCAGYSCFGLLPTNTMACSGNGTCSGPNKCTCKAGYVGAKCDFCGSGWNMIGGKCTSSGAASVAIGLISLLGLLLVQFLNLGSC